MMRATVQSEQEAGRGWHYAVRLESGGDQTDHQVRLDWSDHDHWSGGTVFAETSVQRHIEPGCDRTRVLGG